LINASGLPGNRVELNREGMTATTLVEGDGSAGASPAGKTTGTANLTMN